MSYLPYEPQQQSLLPQALQDWLPEGLLAYFDAEKNEPEVDIPAEIDSACGVCTECKPSGSSCAWR